MTALDVSERSGALGWYREFGPGEKRTFWACFGGWALDAMDVQVYSFVVPTLIMIFHMSNADAGLIGTATLLTSAFGGWIAGALSDRLGRVRTLQVTILWFAVFSFLCGFAQNGTQLLIIRALMGLGFGGEWVTGSVLMGEMIRAEHRGKAVGTVQSGWAIGWGVAAIAQTIAFTFLPPDIAWRVLFWIGLLPALLIFYIRAYVAEPPVYKAMRDKLIREGSWEAFVDIFSPAVLMTTIVTSLLATGAQGGYYAITTWLPTFLRSERHLTVLSTSGYLAVIIVGSFIGYLVSAYLADRIGRRANFVVYAVCSVITVVAYTQIPVTDTVMLALGFPLGFFASGIFSGMGPFFTEQFPTRMRGSGQGFSYNFGRGVAAINPWLVGLMSATLPLGQSIGLFAIIAYGIVIVAAVLLPETKGRELTADG